MESDAPDVPLDPPAVQPLRAPVAGPRSGGGWGPIIVAVAIFAAIGGFIVLHQISRSFGYDNPKVLRAIKRDPMAWYVPPGITGRPQILTTEAGQSMGMPRYGELFHRWRVPRGDAVAAFAEPMRVAKRRGWHFDDISLQPTIDRRGTPDPRSVSRMVRSDNGLESDFPVLLSIYLFDDSTSGGPFDPTTASIQIELQSRTIDCDAC